MPAPVDSLEKVTQRVNAARTAIAKLGVSSIDVFGSFVNGNPTADSDVDILVEFVPEHHTFDNFMDLAFLLEDLLGRKVELVTPEALSPYIGPHILREVKRVLSLN